MRRALLGIRRCHITAENMNDQRELISHASARRHLDGYRRPVLAKKMAVPSLLLTAPHPVERYGHRRAILRWDELRSVERPELAERVADQRARAIIDVLDAIHASDHERAGR